MDVIPPWTPSPQEQVNAPPTSDAIVVVGRWWRARESECRGGLATGPNRHSLVFVGTVGRRCTGTRRLSGHRMAQPRGDPRVERDARAVLSFPTGKNPISFWAEAFPWVLPSLHGAPGIPEWCPEQSLVGYGDVEAAAKTLRDVLDGDRPRRKPTCRNLLRRELDSHPNHCGRPRRIPENELTPLRIEDSRPSLGRGEAYGRTRANVETLPLQEHFPFPVVRTP